MFCFHQENDLNKNCFMLCCRYNDNDNVIQEIIFFWLDTDLFTILVWTNLPNVLTKLTVKFIVFGDYLSLKRIYNIQITLEIDF